MNEYHIISFQAFGNRFYEHCEIRLRNKSISCMQNWNKDKNNVKQDRRFIQLLLMDVFSITILKKSSAAGGLSNNNGVRHDPLDVQLLKFIHG